MGGGCDPSFSAVGEAFESNLASGLELGAACAVVASGRLVVDLWGGSRTPDGPPWEADTLVDCRSATKGLTALCLHLLAHRGLVDLDGPVRRYWPALRCETTVGQALSHQAGIPVLDDVPVGAILDWDTMAGVVERQGPMWAPGERHGYHGASFGWLVGEPVRRLSGRTLSSYFRTEVVTPLELDCFMGTPASEQPRVATLVPGLASHRRFSPPPAPTPTESGAGPSLAARMYAPVLPPLAPPMNDSAFRSAAIPVTGATGTARAFATLYGDLARRDGRLLPASAVARMAEVQVDGIDAVLGIPVRRSLGFELTPPWADDGRPAYCFGHPGGGGVVAFADAQAGFGFAYLNNAAWSGAPGTDPRAANLIRALYASV